jgi:hypothetical protein
MEISNKMQKKSMASPDETRTFEKGKIEFAKVGNTSIGKGYFEPGWLDCGLGERNSLGFGFVNELNHR